MTPRRKKRVTLFGVAFLGLSASLGLLLYALSQNIDLFYTPEELIFGKGEVKALPEVGSRLRIGGLVLPGSLQRADDSLKVNFVLVDASGAQVNLSYEGILPDLFREGQGIVANGILVSANHVQAKQVLAKHDEEYMPPEVADSLKGIEHFKPEYTQQQLDGSAPSRY